MDPRIQRTREALSRAMLDQIQHKRWDKITVQSLLDATGCSRSTFYAHYDNKLAVLTSNIGSVAGTMTVDAESDRVNLRSLFSHVDEAAAVLRPIMSQPVLREITDEFERQFTVEFSKLVENEDSLRPRFLAGALIAIVRQYATERNRRPPAEVADETSNLISSLLSSAQ